MKRIIQVGVGGMGLVWTDRVAESDRWEAAAYVDVDRKNLTAAAVRHRMPKRRCFTDLAEALRTVEADALLDVTPQKARRKVCCAAMDHGLHVLSEKPLADNLRNAKAVVSRAEKTDRVYMVAQDYRYQQCVQTARNFIEKGRLGELGYAGVRFHKGPRFGGFREKMAYPLLLDMSIHHLDMMRCMTGADIVSVTAKSVKAPWNWFKGDATVIAEFQMTRGVTVGYDASWVANGWETPWNGNWRFDGSAGVLLLEGDEVTFSNTPGRRRKVRPVKWARSRQAYLLDAFRDAVDSGNEPETSGRRNLNSLAATFAAVRSVKEERRVDVDELLQ